MLKIISKANNLGKIGITSLLAIILNISFYHLLLSHSPILAQAEESNRVKESNQKPTRYGFPIRRQGGATRGGCNLDKDEAPLIALIPPDGVVVTASKSPALLFYFPEISQGIIEFMLRDSEDKILYRKKILDDNFGEIASITLPLSEDIYSQTQNQSFTWSLNIRCLSLEYQVKGTIKTVSVDPNLTNQIKTASGMEKVQLYQEAGLWHDAISTLVQLKKSDPENPDVIQGWNLLLQSAEFHEYLEVLTTAKL